MIRLFKRNARSPFKFEMVKNFKPNKMRLPLDSVLLICLNVRQNTYSMPVYFEQKNSIKTFVSLRAAGPCFEYS